MKNLITLFIFLPFLTVAQVETTRDTSYLLNRSGTFFEVHRIEYSDSSYAETSSRIGDTSAMLSVYVNRIAEESQQIAKSAATAYQMRVKTSEWAKTDTVITAQLLRSPITAIADSYEREFLDGDWDISFGSPSTSVDVTFPRLSTNKRIRLQPNGQSAKTMLIYGNVIRLVSYPFSGLNTLFRLREGVWINLDYGNPAARVMLRRK